MKLCLNPDDLPVPPQPYSQVVVVRTKEVAMIYVSGQIAIEKDGSITGAGNVSLQAKRVYEKIQSALKSVGATMSDIVSMTTYLTDMRLSQSVGAVRREFFTDEKNLPTSTFVGVSALGRPELLIEVSVTAVKELGENP